MGVQQTSSRVVTKDTTSKQLGAFFTVTGASNPAFLVVNALDRNEYTVSATGETGAFSGNGSTLDLASIGGDGRGAGIVFTWQPASHQYVNAIYGVFNQLTFTSANSPFDVTSISLFTTSNANLAKSCASSAYALMQEDASGYVGSVTFSNDPKLSGVVAGNATPDAIAAAARQLVGTAWNDEGCWVLASTIAAAAGAGLPIQSTAISVPGKANGGWIVIYNGPAGAVANWQSLVCTGDMVVFGTSGGGGHITTCVSGSGATAMLVDNVTYENASGQILNSANDGSASDVLISPPHPAIQEWLSARANSVVIYALDTPVITDLVSAASVNFGGTLALSSLFSAKDPAGKSVTRYQIYQTSGSDSLLLNGHLQATAGSGSPITASSLGALSFLAGAVAATDCLEIRAFNGTYWGDWQSLTVNVVAQSPQATGIETKAIDQSGPAGQIATPSLPSGTLGDQQSQALGYFATASSGTALSLWLDFNPNGDGFAAEVTTSAFGTTRQGGAFADHATAHFVSDLMDILKISHA